MIKNIIFDVGNVLVNFRPKEYMRDLGFPEDVIEVITDNIVSNDVWNELDRGIQTQEEVVQQMKTMVPGYEDYMDKFFADGRELVWTYDYSADWLKTLKDRGFNTYILSNYPEKIWKVHEKEKFTFIPYVDGKIVSGFVKLIKPDEAIYRKLLDTYKLNPEECIFIDDRLVNVEAADKIGIHAIQFIEKAQVDADIEKIISENADK